MRTVFAVGDRKQSIYSFQGADIEEFDRSHRLLRERVDAAGRPWQDAGLDVSFRSTQPVLELVDRVFANPIAARRRRGAGPDADPLRRPGATMPASSSCGRSRRCPSGRAAAVDACRSRTRA